MKLNKIERIKETQPLTYFASILTKQRTYEQ